MRNSYKRRPEDFKRKILSRIYTNRVDTFLKEGEWLKLIKPHEIKIRYYNLHVTIGHWTMYPENVKTVKDKISHILQEKLANGWDRTQKEETKIKISKTRKEKKLGPSEACREAHKIALTGRKQSPEHISKASVKRNNSVWVNKNNKNKFIQKEMLDTFILNGYSLGRTEKTKLLCLSKLSDGKGANNAFFGKSHSDEAKKKMSEAKKGRIPWNKGLKNK